jgi:hypothetical protein
MIPRYMRSEMGRIWSDENKYRGFGGQQRRSGPPFARLGRLVKYPADLLESWLLLALTWAWVIWLGIRSG